MSADPQATEPAKPSRSRKPRRFASPRGGDVDPKGTRVVQYYNPSPGVVAKRQRIKRVAARLFAERGLAAVGLTQVSHAMNLPSGSVKYYFRNRDDVLADILADHEVALSQRVGAAYDATATAGPVARLAALVEAFYRSVLAAADAHRALLFSTAAAAGRAAGLGKGALPGAARQLRRDAGRACPGGAGRRGRGHPGADPGAAAERCRALERPRRA